MTTHIPSLTLPSAVFQHTATSVLLPIALGTAIGYSTKREHLQSHHITPLQSSASTYTHQPTGRSRRTSR